MNSETKYKNYVSEAAQLIDIIDESKVRQKDYTFFLSMKAKVKLEDFVSEKAIYWLRDIKDRQLEG